MTIQTLTLTDFLLARIAEDEAQARLAIAKRESIAYARPPAVPDMVLEAFEDVGVPAVLVGPERVLAECEGKRRTIDRLNRNYGCPCVDILYDLALPYADHPDYNPDWRL